MAASPATGRPRRAAFDHRRLEFAAVVIVLVGALLLRVIRLGSIPNIVTADEADNLQVAYKIIEGTGPGFFGFDWKPAPIFSLYPLAWSVQAFGGSVAAFRMFPVILAMSTLVAFYLVARTKMGVFAATTAMGMLAGNLVFLHFSRTAWENLNAALFALGACYTTERALCERRGRAWLMWWSISGLFITFGLYGYFTGRFIFVAVTLIAVIAIAFDKAPRKPTLGGLAVAAVVSAVLFLPMAMTILGDWDVFARRSAAVSVFNVADGQSYLGDSNGWVIAAKNVVRNYEGFVLQSESEMGRGLWARYNPINRPPLDFITKHLFWGGLVVGGLLWRKSYAWFAFFVPLFIAESFSTGTPDTARGVIIVPFYFLFIGLLLHEVRNALTSDRTRAVFTGAVVCLAAAIVVLNVTDYFEWQREPAVQLSRLPGIAACEFELWSELARDAAADGALVDGAAFEEARRELACSPLINEWLGPAPD